MNLSYVDKRRRSIYVKIEKLVLEVDRIPIAYVLADIEVDKVKSVLEKIRKVEGVSEAYTVAGEKDIIVKAEAENFQKVAEAVTQNIHRINGVEDTVTYFAFE